MNGVKNMTIKEQYRRARRNYLRRVNRAVNRGYRPDTLPIPKYITRRSINALERRTGEYIRSHSVMVNPYTGDEIRPTRNKKKRRENEKAYVEFMSQPLQNVADTVYNGGVFEYEPDAIMSEQESYEQLIDNWYENIRENFYWYIAQFIESQTNGLIYGQPAETRKRFAYVYAQNPDIFPEPPYDSRENVIKSFNEIARMMELASGSEAYYDFLSMYDGVESEV